MDPDLGHVSYDTDRPGFLGTGDQFSWLNRRYSDATAEAMDRKLRELIDGQFDRTVALFEANRDLLDNTARDLVELETLDEPDLAEIAAKVGKGT